MPSFRAGRRLRKALRKRGGGSFLDECVWQFAMLRDPNKILRDSDDAEIRDLKIDFINKCRATMRGHVFTFIWLACGFAITVIITVVEVIW